MRATQTISFTSCTRTAEAPRQTARSIPGFKERDLLTGAREGDRSRESTDSAADDDVHAKIRVIVERI
jgi:hypothetical protein